MTLFKDLIDGAVFFTRCGTKLQKVLEDDSNINAVFADSSHIGVMLNENERTFTEEEFVEIAANDKLIETR